MIEQDGYGSRYRRIKRILDQSLTGSMKIFRICKRFMPRTFKPTSQFLEKFRNVKRTEILKRRMAFQQLNNRPHVIHLMGLWAQIKHSLKIYELGTIKSYFITPRQQN